VGNSEQCENFELFGTPPPEQFDEILPSFGRQLFRFNGAGQYDGQPDLLEVCRAVWASSEVYLESVPIST
jgi:hypothetical protein